MSALVSVFGLRALNASEESSWIGLTELQLLTLDSRLLSRKEFTMSEQHIGKVVEVIGPVVVVAFEGGHLPPIYNAVRITSEGFDVPQPIDVIAEVEQHLGEGRVKCVAMQPTDGMVRGMKARTRASPSPCRWAKARWAA